MRLKIKLYPWQYVVTPILALLLLTVSVLLTCPVAATAEKAPKPYDVYLTGDRICRKCTWQVLSDGRVRLTGPQGHSALYTRAEILGVNNHPIWRRLVHRMNQGNGLAGQVINPTGYDPLNPRIGHPFRDYEVFEPLPVYTGH